MKPDVFGSAAFKSLNLVNWDDCDAIELHTFPVFDLFRKDPSSILTALKAVRYKRELLLRAESDAFFDRVILFENCNFSVRLHFLRKSNYHRPHNHRASFATMILFGGYLHSLYDFKYDYVPVDNDHCLADLATLDLTNSCETQLNAGSTYSIHHKSFHSTLVEKMHMSLVIRGPSQKEQLLFLDLEKNSAEWMYGGADEEVGALENKRMTYQKYCELVELTKSWLAL